MTPAPAAGESPNATGSSTVAPSVYALADDGHPARVVTANMYNESDPYAHVLTLNVSKVDLVTIGNNVSTVNQVFELTVSEAKIQRLASQNLSMTWAISPVINVSGSVTGINGSCLGSIGDNCTAALVDYYASYHTIPVISGIPACVEAAKKVNLYGGDGAVYGFASVFNTSLVPDPALADIAGFYNQTSGANPGGSLSTRFNESGYPSARSFGFPTRSALFYNTKPATAKSNFSMYDNALSHYSFIIVQEHSAAYSPNERLAGWIAVHCIRADHVTQGSREPARSGAIRNDVGSSLVASAVAVAVVATLVCM